MGLVVGEPVDDMRARRSSRRDWRMLRPRRTRLQSTRGNRLAGLQPPSHSADTMGLSRDVR